jgi:hypothetical protein
MGCIVGCVVATAVPTDDDVAVNVVHVTVVVVVGRRMWVFDGDRNRWVSVVHSHYW